MGCMVVCEAEFITKPFGIWRLYFNIYFFMGTQAWDSVHHKNLKGPQASNDDGNMVKRTIFEEPDHVISEPRVYHKSKTGIIFAAKSNCSDRKPTSIFLSWNETILLQVMGNMWANVRNWHKTWSSWIYKTEWPVLFKRTLRWDSCVFSSSHVARLFLMEGFVL